MALKPKQLIFVRHYLDCLDATEAAKRTGYAESSATQRGYEHMHNPDVKEAIRQHFDAKGMSKSEVMQILSEHARAEYSDYIFIDGKGKPAVNVAKLIADGKGYLIKSIKYTAYGVNVEFHDVQAALTLLGKQHGLFVERTEVTGKDGKAIAVDHNNVSVSIFLPDNGRDDRG